MIRIFANLFGLLSRSQRWRLAWVLALAVVAALLEAASVGLVLPFVSLVGDPAALTKNPAIAWVYGLVGSPDPKIFLILSAVLVSVAFVVRNIYLGMTTLIRQRFVFSLYRSLASRLMRCFLHRAYVHALSRNSADFVRVIMQDAVNVASGAVDPILVIITECIITFGLLILLINVRPFETLLTFAIFGIVMALTSPMMRRRVAALAQVSHNTYSEMLKWGNQTAGGVREASVLGRRQYFIDQFQASSHDFANARAAYMVFKDVPRLIMEALAVMVIMGLVAVLVLKNQSSGEIMPFLAMVGVAAFRMMPSATRIYAATIGLRFAIPQIQAVMTDFAEAEAEGIDIWLEADPREKPADTPLPFTQTLALKDVSFRYPGAERPALNRLSLTIPKGASIGIVGPSGGGKTTLIGILLGLLSPQSGDLCVDGVATNDQDGLTAWRRRIGYIPQDIFLLDDSIRANVAFGVPADQVDGAAVLRAIKAAQLEDFIAAQPQGLDTMVGERGVKLSGGQRQRIAIARALYPDPDVLLLDEATASLDNQTERELTRAIDALSGTKTIIMVAHRLTTVRKCDRLYFLKDGAITAQGDYDSLLQFEEFRQMASGD